MSDEGECVWNSPSVGGGIAVSCWCETSPFDDVFEGVTHRNNPFLASVGQVWSLTKFNSVDFLQSRIGVFIHTVSWEIRT